MQNLNKIFKYLIGIFILSFASTTAFADIVVNISHSDEITITNTQDVGTNHIRIEEQQSPVSYEGSDKNLANTSIDSNKTIETHERKVVAEIEDFADEETTTTNLKGELITFVTAEVTIKSSYNENGSLLISVNNTKQVRSFYENFNHNNQYSKNLPYHKEVLIAAKKTSVEPALIHAIISAESNYNPKAVSEKGAIGLMQIMPSTARFYKVTDHTDPQQNINAGASLLSDLLRKFNGDIKLSLAAYNAGVNAVLKHQKKIPPFKETQKYVPKVLKAYQRFSSYI